MANPMQVKLVIFDTTHTRLLGKTDIIASFDATRAVKTIDIDPIKFIDEDTLMVSERKCTITFCNIYNSYKYVKDRLNTVEEDTLSVPYNIFGGVEYDIVNTTRMINFLVPFALLRDRDLYDDLGQNIFAYPVYYLTSDDISYIPFVDEGEDKYNKYDQYYQVERGKYHNILVEVYFYDKLQYVGVALINTLKFNIKSQEWSLEFTDAIGIMITCLDKLGSLPSLYQGVDYSGLFLKHLYDIPKLTIESMYYDFMDIFNYKGFYTYYGSSLTLTVRCTYGSNHTYTYYDFKLEDTQSQIVINTIPNNNGYRRWQRTNNTPFPGANTYQYKKYIYYKVCKDSQNNNIAEIDVLFFEVYRGRTGSEWNSNYHIVRTALQIVFGLKDCIYYRGRQSVESSSYSSYYTLLSLAITKYMNDIGGTWINSGIDADWDTGVYPGAIASYNYGFTATNPITFGTSPTPSQEMQNLFYAFNGENDEGFNSQISILDAYKLHLLSKVETIYSRGYDIIRKPFKKSTTTNFTVNGRYIKELTIEPYYYEKPDLSVIENITKWEGKTKDELHTRVNLKDWTASLMETIPPGQTEKITVAIILKDTYYNDIEIGNKIRIYPLYYCLPDEPTTNELYFIVTSIKWSLNELTLEGFRI